MVNSRAVVRSRGRSTGYNALRALGHLASGAGMALRGGVMRRLQNQVGNIVNPVNSVRTSRRARSKRRSGPRGTLVGAAKYVKRGKKVSKQNPYKVTQKIEYGATNGAWNAIYVGGSTHPSQPLVRIIAQSIVRFLALKSKVDFGNWSAFCSMPISGGSNFNIVYWYHTAPFIGFPAPTTLVKINSNGKTWLQLADDLASSFVVTFAKAAESLRMTAIGLQQDTTPLAPVPLLTSQYYMADNLYISVKGESAIQVQNRTASDDSSASLDAENVYANPLRGKYYSCKGPRALFRDPDNALSTNYTYFNPDSSHGTIGDADRFGGTVSVPTAGTSIFPPPIENSLQKPPPGGFFSNCDSTKYLTVTPGEILRSKLVREYRFNIPKWLDILQVKFETVAAKTYVGLAGTADPFELKIGSCHFYGLEKMCDTVKAATPGYDRIKCGIEHNLFMSGHCQYRPKFGVAPLVNIRT